MEENYRNKFCILGVPDHQGVLHVGGRLGAALGPEAFRRHFAKIQGLKRDKIVDLGNVTGLGSDVGNNHAEAIRQMLPLATAARSIVVGGGHDHGFTHLKALYDGSGKNHRLGCINIDAHYDLRKPSPTISSGSPFYLALQAGILEPKNLIEFGIQPQSNSADLADFAKSKKIETYEFSALRNGRSVAAFKKVLSKLSSRVNEVVISLDLDSFAQAYAPGVSAPQAEGFTPSDVFEMLTLARKNKKVKSLGIFELNPLHDVHEATARLAAHCAFMFFQED
jgi:formiminoglutamase